MVRKQSEGGGHVIPVSDTGTGKSAEVVAHAFKPVFTTEPVGEGSGLGLSQVYGFAVQSGGTAVIDNAAGAGPTVRLFLSRGLPAAASVAPYGLPVTLYSPVLSI